MYYRLKTALSCADIPFFTLGLFPICRLPSTKRSLKTAAVNGLKDCSCVTAFAAGQAMLFSG